MPVTLLARDRRAAAFALLAAGIWPLTAAATEGFATTNESTFSRPFALPAMGQVEMPAAGEDRFAVTFDLTNEYAQEAEGRELLLLDGETQRWTARFRHGFGYGWEWTSSVPLVHTGGGFLDHTIEDWHDTLGLPDAGRGSMPRNRFEYRYERDGEVRFDRTHGGTELGDARVGLGCALAVGLVGRVELKLPTGDDDHLTGGNNFGTALWLDWALPLPERSRLGGFLSGGVAIEETADGYLPGQQRNVVPVASLGLSYRLFTRFDVLAQLDTHGPLYKGTDINALERPGVQFVFGGRYRLTHGTYLELAFQEDPIVAVSPDFSIHVGLSVR